MHGAFDELAHGLETSLQVIGRGREKGNVLNVQSYAFLLKHTKSEI